MLNILQSCHRFTDNNNNNRLFTFLKKISIRTCVVLIVPVQVMLSPQIILTPGHDVEEIVFL